MNKIMLLEESLINKISAGEVVEKPASIVKELVENSIDADSKNITIEIEGGGIPYIKITDDGCGMNEIDAVLAFGRHATSKIKSINDLYNINTLGFRGEALASISSISKVTLHTREDNALYGTKIVIEGGKIIEKNTCGCQKGSTVEVRDVFFNTPARRKFLKRPSTEAMYITNIITKICLAHPEISFKYIKDKKLEFITSGNEDVLDVILRLYGKEIYTSLIKTEYNNEYLKIKMYLSKPEFTKSNREMQLLFVNGRYVKNKVFNAAIEEGYKTLIPVNRYPAVITYIYLDSREIDVNVHPTKLEIRFSDEKTIFNSIYKTIKDCLEKTNIIPEARINNYFKLESHKESIDKQNSLFLAHSLQDNKSEQNQKEEQCGIDDNNTKTIFESKESEKVFDKNFNDSESMYLYSKNYKCDAMYDNYDFKIIGTLFSTYIIIEKNNVCYLIDQHAAHERILYEKFMSQYNKIEGKQTTIPIVVDMAPGNEEILKQNINILRRLGYKFEWFGNNSVILREVPIILGQPEARQLFIDIIDKLKEKDSINNINLKEEDIIMMACKKAVKSMDKLSHEEIYKLFNDLKITENPYTCPHGRPVIVSITKYQLEKMFKRIK
ncbi:DNA mismatch repair endonuclease MutL [Aceticella autotrophica]|uniref:DNA mismatch repair protein MutL n=1 Tax=Aceticella autotrophica TaxID=2755338 RepID=A0A974Y2I7_9THEO|nr:DNA mismatch repair endonuclease MutL [Aceticella autotrophica]QSZ26413.1 DNA mismatch repair endonuclease MutL [Aceticella autotrophica]